MIVTKKKVYLLRRHLPVFCSCCKRAVVDCLFIMVNLCSYRLASFLTYTVLMLIHFIFWFSKNIGHCLCSIARMLAGMDFSIIFLSIEFWFLLLLNGSSSWVYTIFVLQFSFYVFFILSFSCFLNVEFFRLMDLESVFNCL